MHVRGKIREKKNLKITARKQNKESVKEKKKKTERGVNTLK